MKNLLFYLPDRLAEFRIFFFPYAGGGASIAEIYRNKLPKEIDLCPIQLPGREDKIRETPYNSLSPMINDLLVEISPYLDKPFALWGHCSGALIAFALAEALEKYLKIEPNFLLVCACIAPQIIQARLKTIRHKLSNRDLMEEIETLSKTNQVTTNTQAQILPILLDTVRADFTCYETYNFPFNTTKLNTPIFALGGTNDIMVNSEDILAWQDLTNKRIETQIIQNAYHLFVNTHVDYLTETVKNCVQLATMELG